MQLVGVAHKDLTDSLALTKGIYEHRLQVFEILASLVRISARYY